MITHQSSGMFAPSATNPLDEVPIGPQIFPFWTPSVNQSQVNPNYVTNYQTGQTAGNVIQSTKQVYAPTTYQTSAPQVIETGAYQTAEAYPATTYQTAATTQVIDTGAYQTEAVQQVVDAGAYQTTEVLPTTTYQTFAVQQEIVDVSA